MFKRSGFYALGFICAAFLASCVQEQHSSVIRVESWQPKLAQTDSIIVCRQKQCAPTSLSMSSEFIYNSLAHLLDNNNHNTLLPCTADPKTHVCTEEYVVLPLTVGVTPAFMYINSVKISDMSMALNRTSLDLILNYNVTYNGQTPVCKPAKSLIYVKNTKNIIMEDSGYACKMTTIGSSVVKTLFAIDYIDLDYGYIGGYYSIGVSGPAFGGGSGYMLLRLPKDAYPLSPELMDQQEIVKKDQNQAEEDVEAYEYEEDEEFFEPEAPTKPSKIKVTVRTTTKGKHCNGACKCTGKAKSNGTCKCTGKNARGCPDIPHQTKAKAPEAKPDTVVNVEYTDQNGVQIFPFVKPHVQVKNTKVMNQAPQPPVQIIDTPLPTEEKPVEQKPTEEKPVEQKADTPQK